MKQQSRLLKKEYRLFISELIEMRNLILLEDGHCYVPGRIERRTEIRNHLFRTNVNPR